MNHVATGIKLTDLKTAWGLVVVADANGAVLREYKISAQDADAVGQLNIAPPGCTQAEWESGLVLVITRPCNPGQAVVGADGSLTVNYGVTEQAARVRVSLMQLMPNEWHLEGDVVYVDDTVAAQIATPVGA